MGLDLAQFIYNKLIYDFSNKIGIRSKKLIPDKGLMVKGKEI